VTTRARRARATCAILVAAAAACAFSAGAEADGGSYRMRATPAGMAAAAAVAVTAGDLGSVSDWKGGRKKADISTLSCPGFHPKTADLVLNGASAASYLNAGVTMRTDAQVFASAAMAASDWQRTVGSPKLIPCLRSRDRTSWTGADHFVSLKTFPLPKLPVDAIGFREIVVATRNGRKIRIFIDSIGFIRGKSEVRLLTIMNSGSAPSIFPNEIVLVKTLISRAAI
jgi:hypothetical protein